MEVVPDEDLVLDLEGEDLVLLLVLLLKAFESRSSVALFSGEAELEQGSRRDNFAQI